MSPALHNRILSASGVALVWTLAALSSPTPEVRQERIYLLVATLGYGHLIGAAGLHRWVSRARAASRAGGLASALAATSIATGFCAYSLLLAAAPAAIVPFALASTWHTLENDRQLHAAQHGRGRLPPLRSGLREHRWFAWGAIATLGLLACTTEIREALSLARLPSQLGLIDVYGAPALYHVLSWLKLSLDRARSEQRERSSTRLYRELAVVHILPLTIAPLALVADSGLSVILREILYGPQIYLYWSTLHVLHTALLRTRPRPIDTTFTDPLHEYHPPPRSRRGHTTP
jgi:hypothetical protein